MVGFLLAAALVTTWPAPPEEKPSPHFTMSVNGVEVFVYQAPVRAQILKKPGLWSHELQPEAEAAAFAIFDLGGSATVVVRPQRDFKTATVLPTRAGIVPLVEGGNVSFQIQEPRHLTLVLDGKDAIPLHLFVSRPEQDPPRADDPNVIYFGPGLHEIRFLQPRSGQTVYLAGGAVVRVRPKPAEEGESKEKMQVRFKRAPGIYPRPNVSGVRVCGRGILDGGLVGHPGAQLIAFDHARDIRLEGITLRDSANWNVRIDNAENVTVDNLRIISARLNSDGIDSVNSRNVRIRNCFVRTSDDSIVAKTVAPDRSCEDIEVEDCVIWNDWGYALGVTYETRAPIQHVRFRRCDVLFARHWCMGIHVSDGATVSNVSFSDIHLEALNRASVLPGGDALTTVPKLARLVIAKDMWGKDAERGHIRDVHFDRISVDCQRLPPAEIAGADSNHLIENISFQSLSRRAVRTQWQVEKNEFVRGISIDMENEKMTGK